MIAGINSSGSLIGIYPQYNTTPVKRVSQMESGKTDSLVEEKEQNLPALTKTKFQAKVEEAYSNSTKVAEYSQNPYDQVRKNVEQSILTGQNIDIVA